MTSHSKIKFLIRSGTQKDVSECANIDTDAFHIFTTERRHEHLAERANANQLLVAVIDRTIVGYATFDANWFKSTFLKLVVVAEGFQRRGIASALIREIAASYCPSGRLFSSTEDNNEASLAMHQHLGFRHSGYIDNLPQPGREIFLFLKVS
jgi:ribosomal protein S18 acetylase RimI-like enzyme